MKTDTKAAGGLAALAALTAATIATAPEVKESTPVETPDMFKESTDARDLAEEVELAEELDNPEAGEDIDAVVEELKTAGKIKGPKAKGKDGKKTFSEEVSKPSRFTPHETAILTGISGRRIRSGDLTRSEIARIEDLNR